MDAEEEIQRRIVITRHAERLDGWIHKAKFNCHPYQIPVGKSEAANWLDFAFIDGNYVQFDENSPSALPLSKPLPDWRHDSPITLKGERDSRLLVPSSEPRPCPMSWIKGTQMKERGDIPDLIFVSPALRAVQTAVAMREGLGVDVPLKVEPGIFEFFTRVVMPPLLDTADYARAGLPVDAAYVPFRPAADLRAPEPYPDYYNRLHDFLRWAIAKYPEAKRIQLVSHSTTMDTGTRMLRGLPPLSKKDFWTRLMPNLNFDSYLSSVAVNQRRDSEWVMVEPPPQPTPELRSTFDWKFMIPDLSSSEGYQCDCQ